MRVTVEIPDKLVQAIKDTAENILGREPTAVELQLLIAEDIEVQYEQNYLANYPGGGYHVDYEYIQSCLEDIVTDK